MDAGAKVAEEKERGVLRERSDQRRGRSRVVGRQVLSPAAACRSRLRAERAQQPAERLGFRLPDSVQPTGPDPCGERALRFPLGTLSDVDCRLGVIQRRRVPEGSESCAPKDGQEGGDDGHERREEGDQMVFPMANDVADRCDEAAVDLARGRQCRRVRRRYRGRRRAYAERKEREECARIEARK